MSLNSRSLSAAIYQQSTKNMKYYNTKDWLGILFKVTKADVLRKLWWILLIIAAYSGFIAYLELGYWKLERSLG